MRIAIPVTGDQIANHLGHCERYLFADVENGVVIQTAEVPNPGHGPGGPPPAFLARSGVNQVVCWGVPAHAVGMLENMGVKVLLGATGEPMKALANFLNGTLELTTEGLEGGGGCSC